MEQETQQELLILIFGVVILANVDALARALRIPRPEEIVKVTPIRPPAIRTPHYRPRNMDFQLYPVQPLR